MGSNEVAPTLPAGLSLAFDLTQNQITPPQYSGGIQNTYDTTWNSIWRPYGFYIAACADIQSGGRFAPIYATFVQT
jgi:hypothetical protein